MNFETAFAHYRAHTATAEETVLVEQELKKLRLLEDYLAEEDLPGLSEIPQPPEATIQAETQVVQRRLKRRERRIVISAAAIVLALLALLQWVVSPLVNRAVYDDRWLGADYSEADYREFDVGMSVLAGLYMPLGDFQGSTQMHSGFMTDTIYLSFHSYARSGSDNRVDSQLTLRLGRLGPLNSNDLRPLGYAVLGYFDNAYSSDGSVLEPSEDSQNALATLPEYIRVTAAVTFDATLSADELAMLMARHPELDFLSAKVTGDGASVPQGVFCSLRQMSLGYGDTLDAVYPEIQLTAAPDVTGTMLQQHFESLLQYMIDHPRLVQMAEMLNSSSRYQAMLDSVRETGLLAEGVWVQGTPSAILALMEEPCAASVSNHSAIVSLYAD